MKPSFALNLTDTSITLLHRTARGWMDVGSVSFGDPDMGAALEYLRSTALGLSADRITTKLIIPDSQVLYLQVQAPGPDDTSRRAQVEAALDGRTPYALDELAFDWVANGAVVDVAVVARETLAEAEGFAAEHRFNPVSFVARADNGFGKEPFFGMTAGAPALIGADEKVAPDPDPVTIIAREALRAETAPPETASPEASAPETPAPEIAPPEIAPPESGQPESGQPESGPDEASAPKPHPSATSAAVAATPEPIPAPPEPEVPQPAPPETPEPPPAELPAPAAPDLPPDPDLPEPTLPEPMAPEPTAPNPMVPQTPSPPAYDPPAYDPPAPPPPAYDPPAPPVTLRATPEDDAEAPMAVDVPLDEPVRSRSASVLAAEMPPAEDVPPPLSPAALTAFASRRAAADDTARPLGAAVQPDAAPARSMAPAALRAGTAPKPVVDRPVAARPTPKFSYDDPLPPPQRLPGDPPAAAGAMIGKASKGLRSIGNLVTSPTIPGTRKKKTLPIAATSGPVPRPALASPAPPAMTSSLTAPAEASVAAASMKAAAQTLSRPKAAVSPDAIGRGLGARSLPQRGKPRFLGLILTGVLLLILALVAAWSSFYLTRGDDPPTEVASVEDEAQADGADLAASDASLPDGPDAGPDAGPVAAPVEAPVATPVPSQPASIPEPAPQTPEPAPQTAVQAEAAGAIQPAPSAQDEIFLASMDTPPRLSDPLVLPQPSASGDAVPAAQMPPPPFGTVYQFDANGRIMPTADGIVTPEGVTLVAGAPPLRPPQRPAASVVPVAAATAAAPIVTAPPATDPSATADATPAETFAANPALADARPQARPAQLVPAVPEADGDTSLAPEADSRFASLRPRARPVEVLAAGEAARRASESASLALQSAAVEAAVASAEAANLSPLAVSVSRVPAPRPRELSRAVEAAVAAATRTPEVRAEPEQVVAAASTAASSTTRRPAAEEDDSEPEVASSAAPRIPTRANVAKQATFTNAINLSKINLIGVYGTQSNRTALVRQANGRYRKVSVGDNIDGGRVQAITATELRYQKGGRLLSLAMPKG